MADLPFWTGCNRVPGIGIVRLRRLIDAFGSAEGAWSASRHALISAGLSANQADALLSVRATFDSEGELRRLRDAGVVGLPWDAPEYPPMLREAPGAPPVLFVRGVLPVYDRPWLAVVGTRHATAYGKSMTASLVRDVASAGVVIVSGFARGIDTAAHRAALDAGGMMVAVFACGLDVIYPPENRVLAMKMFRTGAAVAEHGLGTKPEATNFPARNRIIAGLCQATLVIEAGEKSGAFITANFANDQGRDVLAIPGPAFSPRSLSANRLIQDGARLVLSAADVLDALAVGARGSAEARESGAGLAPEDRELLARLSEQPLHTDELARQLDRAVHDVAARLTILELQGRVRRSSGMNYVVPG